MKKIIITAFAALFSLGISAQLISSNTMTRTVKKSNSYNRWAIGYNSVSIGDADAMSGVSLSWAKGFSVSQTTPLYVETGLTALYASKSETVEYDDGHYYEEMKVDNKFAALTVPVNLVYKYEITDGLKLTPYAGLYFRGNIYGSTDDDYEEFDWFSDGDGKRFNFGYQIGVGMEYKKLYVGLGYAGDLNEISDGSKVSTFNVSVGITY